MPLGYSLRRRGSAFEARDFKHWTTGDERWFSAEIRRPELSRSIHFRVRGSVLADGSETLLAALLFPAMRLGRELAIPGRVSPRLYRSIPAIQNLWHDWDGVYQKVDVRVRTGRAGTGDRAGKGVGCFFTAGVDSFYTALEHHDEITHLILVHGFDVAPEQHELWERVSTQVRAAALALDKPLVEIETDLRHFSDPLIHWKWYHGAGLAATALLLAPAFSRAYIASTYRQGQIRAWGSHPDLDPLWSTENLEILHDGADATRLDKVRRIAPDPIVRQHLRVCFQNTDGAYNCGRCEKCLRTMAALRLCGSLDQVQTFDRALSLEAIASLTLPAPNARVFFQELSDAAGLYDADPELHAALEECLQRNPIRV